MKQSHESVLKGHSQQIATTLSELNQSHCNKYCMDK